MPRAASDDALKATTKKPAGAKAQQLCPKAKAKTITIVKDNMTSTSSSLATTSSTLKVGKRVLAQWDDPVMLPNGKVQSVKAWFDAIVDKIAPTKVYVCYAGEADDYRRTLIPWRPDDLLLTTVTDGLPIEGHTAAWFVPDASAPSSSSSSRSSSSSASPTRHWCYITAMFERGKSYVAVVLDTSKREGVTRLVDAAQLQPILAADIALAVEMFNELSKLPDCQKGKRSYDFLHDFYRSVSNVVAWQYNIEQGITFIRRPQFSFIWELDACAEDTIPHHQRGYCYVTPDFRKASKKGDPRKETISHGIKLQMVQLTDGCRCWAPAGLGE